MPEAAGPTNQSGIDYQNSVETLFLGDMLDADGRPPAEAIVSVRGEAPTEVDDIKITFADGHSTFVHCKENIAPSDVKWRELWSDFSQQFNQSDFQQASDRFLLYMGAVTNPLRALREMCARSHGALNYEEWTNSLNAEQLKLRDGESGTPRRGIRGHLGSNLSDPQEMLQFFQSLTVVICVAEDLRRYEACHRMPRCSVAPTTLFDLLFSQVGRAASYRVPLEEATLRQTMEEEHGIRFFALPPQSDLRALFQSCSSVLRGGRNTIGRYGPHLKRDVTPTIARWLQSVCAQNLEHRLAVLLDGPGKGKTVVMRDVQETLERSDVTVLAIKVDRQLDDLGAGRELHQCLGLPDTIERIVTRLAMFGPVVVLFDQVDALSLSLSRDQKALNAVLNEINRLRGLPNVAVLFSCRRFDLHCDLALRSLAVPQQFSLDDFSEDELKSVLAALEVDGEIFTKATRELLRVPLHLDLLALAIENGELSRDSMNKARGLGSLQDLYTLIWNEVVMAPKMGESNPADRVKVLRALTDRMSRDQKTTAPRSLFQSPELQGLQLESAVNDLASAGILSGTMREWSFLHQTFFDYCYAFFFVEDGRCLSEDVLSGPQGLFERPQIMHVLNYLRVTDSKAYAREFSALTRSQKLRKHLHDLLFHWFGALATPDATDWRLAQQMLNDSKQRSLFFQVANSNSGWLPHLEKPLTAMLHEDEDSINLVFYYLHSICDNAQVQATAIQIIHPLLNQSNEWNQRLAWLMSLTHHWHTPEALELYRSLFSSHIGGQLRDDMLLQRLPDVAKTFPQAACQMLGELILAVLQQHQRILQDARDTIENSESSGISEDEIAKLKNLLAYNDPFDEFKEELGRYVVQDTLERAQDSAPLAIIEALLPVIEEAVHHTPRWGHRRFGFPRDPFDNAGGAHIAGHDLRDFKELVTDSLLQSLHRAARESPASLRSALDRLKALPYESPQCLLAEFYAQDVTLNSQDSLNWLLEDERRFYLGTPEQSSSVRLAVALHSRLDKTGQAALESAILRFDFASYLLEPDAPEYEVLQFRGIGQLRLLQRLNRAEIAPTTLDGLNKWEAQFPGYIAPEEPLAGSVGWVGSPIEAAVTQTITDDEWLAAMQEHNDPNRHLSAFSEDFGLHGGAEQLAQHSLKPLVKQEPERFARFALEQMPVDVAANYICAIIEGLAESNAASELLFAVVRRFATHPNTEIKRGVTTALQQRITEGLPGDLLDLLESWIRAPMGTDENFYTAQSQSRPIDPDEHASNTINSGPFMDYLNSDRGSAFRTLMDALKLASRERDANKSAAAKQRRWRLIEFVASDHSMALRAGAIEQLVPLMDDDRERAIRAFENLLNGHSSLLPLYFSVQFLKFGIFRFYPRVKPFIETLRHSDANNAAQNGASLRAVAALHGHDQDTTQELLTGRIAWRRALAQTWANACCARAFSAATRGDCRNELLILAGDEDEWVQRYVASVFHHLTLQTWDEDEAWIEALLKSRSYAHSLDGAAKWLERDGPARPERALGLVDTLTANKPLSRREMHGFGGDPLVRLALQIYNDPLSGEAIKEHAIETFGRLLERFPRDARGALEEWDEGRFTRG